MILRNGKRGLYESTRYNVCESRLIDSAYLGIRTGMLLRNAVRVSGECGVCTHTFRVSIVSMGLTGEGADLIQSEVGPGPT
jgi:hypothetical protein